MNQIFLDGSRWVGELKMVLWMKWWFLKIIYCNKNYFFSNVTLTILHHSIAHSVCLCWRCGAVTVVWPGVALGWKTGQEMTSQAVSNVNSKSVTERDLEKTKNCKKLLYFVTKF